jgi:decaprenyl-phosphate phosphoribosyltransferase
MRFFKIDKTLKRNSFSLDQTVETPIFWKPYLKLLRPRQWTKNLIVFAAPLFAFSINLQTLLGALLAFVLFCCISSSFYIFNDAIDAEADRQHPVKCKRPIASGLVQIPVAIAIAIILLISSLFIGWLRNPALGITLTSYAALQVAYNLRLKHTVILDVVAIAIGFVLRAYAGASATYILLSPWFLICTAMLALFLGIEKRKAELRQVELNGGNRRPVLWRYSLPLLIRMENTVTTGTLTTYALWSSGPQVQGASTSWMMLTLPFVLYGMFRYQFLSDPQEIARRADLDVESGGRSERPEELLLTDRPLLMTVLAWIGTTVIVLLLRSKGIVS